MSTLDAPVTVMREEVADVGAKDPADLRILGACLSVR